MESDYENWKTPSRLSHPVVFKYLFLKIHCCYSFLIEKLKCIYLWFTTWCFEICRHCDGWIEVIDTWHILSGELRATSARLPSIPCTAASETHSQKTGLLWTHKTIDLTSPSPLFSQEETEDQREGMIHLDLWDFECFTSSSSLGLSTNSTVIVQRTLCLYFRELTIL